MSCSHVQSFKRFGSAIMYPEIRAVNLLSSLGGSTGSKTLCMPGEGESRGSSPRFNKIIFWVFFASPRAAVVATVCLDRYFHDYRLSTRCLLEPGQGMSLRATRL